VLIVNGQDEVEQRRVEVGQAHQGSSVVLSGLEAGDRVIVEGIQKARPGVKVTATVVEPQKTLPAASANAEGTTGSGAPTGIATPATGAPAASGSTSDASGTPDAGSSAEAPAPADAAPASDQTSTTPADAPAAAGEGAATPAPTTSQ
jgi:membrane fusion protein (multidrug efflux system)